MGRMEDPVLTELPRHKPLHRPHLDIARRTTVSYLYPEILAHIFGYLEVTDKGRAARVCQAWRDASYHKSVWRGAEAKFHMRRSSADPVILNCLVRRGIKKVRVLSLRQHDGNALKQLLRVVKNLESLSLSGCYMVTETGLVDALFYGAPFCRNLTKLDLSLCKRVSDDSLGAISRHIESLEDLDLGGCCNITNAGLLLIAWGLRKLKRLNLRSCWHVSDQGIAHLAGIDRPSAEGNPDLEYLCLQDCQKLSDVALYHVVNGLKNLRYLNLSFCINVSDSGLKHLSRLPELRELNLRACDNVTDLGLAYLSEGVGHITSLDVSFCDKVGDPAIFHICQGFYNLRVLALSACKISDDALHRIGGLHELEILIVGQCTRISDKGLLWLAESSRSLKSIDLYGCPKITQTGIEKIRSLPTLTHINQNLAHLR